MPFFGAERGREEEDEEDEEEDITRPDKQPSSQWSGALRTAALGGVGFARAAKSSRTDSMYLRLTLNETLPPLNCGPRTPTQSQAAGTLGPCLSPDTEPWPG